MCTEPETGRQKYAFVPIRHKVRSSQCAPTITADNNLFARFPCFANELNSRIDFSNIDPFNRGREVGEIARGIGNAVMVPKRISNCPAFRAYSES